MPTLADLLGAQTDPTLTQTTANTPVVEPLDGPTTVDDVMDRFPEEIYQQGKDTHLYRFLTALAGDAGAGFLKAQAFAARLQFEAEFLNFEVLDAFYAAQFRFNRLKSETYPSYNPDTDALTPTQWDAIQLADQHYKQRVADFFTSLRYGTAPLGMALAAQAASGVPCEVIENYKWIFDQFSDDPLGLAGYGTTNSTAEFIVVPRFIGDQIEAPLLEFQQLITRGYTYNAASLPNARPALGGTGPTVSVSVSYSAGGVTKMVPEVERNVIDILDRVRSVGTIASIHPESVRYSTVTVNEVHASSSRIEVSRLVTGNADVPWPATDPSQNYFIQAGVENEAGHFYGSARELPIVFLTPDGIHAYTEQALSDPLYATSAFFDTSSGFAEFEHFRSEQTGSFPPLLSAIYPFLANLTSDATFVALNAIAINDTPLVFEGRAT